MASSVARHARTARWARPRQHPELGHVNDARVIEDGNPVAAGDVGELELRNPAIMRGYYEMPGGDGGGDRRRVGCTPAISCATRR